MAKTRLAIVLTCEHGGNDVPQQYRSLFKEHRELLESHRGWDPGTLELGKLLKKKLGLPLVAATNTRLLVELNRSKTNSRLWSDVTRVLSGDEKNKIIQAYYDPHRDRVESTIRNHLANSISVLHLGLHSFTPALNGKERNADICFLYDPQRGPESKMAHRLRDGFRQSMPEFRYRMNYPYRGRDDGLTTILRRKFAAKKYMGIELEINQRLVTQKPEWTLIKSNVVKILKSITAD